MSTEHVTITDPNIHEPKGVSSATSGQLIVADGAGSSSWIDFNDVYDVPLAKGVIVNNAVPVTIPAAVDPTLHTSADYVEFTSGYIFDLLVGFTINGGNNNLIIPETGTYNLSFWASVSSTGTNNTTAGAVYINGVSTAPVNAVLKIKLKVAGDIINISGFGVADLIAGDEIGLGFADDVGVDLTVHESTLSMNLIRRV